mmetsp:Transcript_125992/g.251465  ORF Transcript_125992/g.251465 Transcript_125992/m.251465 type:complete len:209 (-) Transcript_125992:176-802(-)|eukprot:CAMPEP_0172713540 /NCGR_PEP_ID=MMETSP1074-20121228/62800_1 /TAXON_ID=2916 /ORGANISM="Ceratium fusus, Strain PA161109" /LENGTH=208 /DNA_ID=CAMNT_0013537663 /DNA_START=439 /DNA_END=1065 /DNA_ORIENTATION=+
MVTSHIQTGQIAVYSAIGVELFYDVLLFTSKFWFLERLSPYIGFGLYLMYFTIVYILQSPSYVWWVLLVRLAAFVIEESVDIAIDLEMHNDLILICDNWPTSEEVLAYTDVRRSLLDFPYWPRPGFFIGSGSAWLPKSAFSADSYHRQPFSRLRFCWLYGVPLIIYAPLALVIGFFVSIPLCFCLGMAWLRGGHEAVAQLWAEMTRTY